MPKVQYCNGGKVSEMGKYSGYSTKVLIASQPIRGDNAQRIYISSPLISIRYYSLFSAATGCSHPIENRVE